MKIFTRLIPILLLGLLSFFNLNAQCPLAGTLYGTIAAPTSCNVAFASPTCHYTSASGGDHAALTSLVAGSTYLIRSSNTSGSTVPNTDELTIYLSTNTTTGNHVAFGTGGSVTFTPTMNGTYVVVINKSGSPCGTLESVCRYISIQCTSCSIPGPIGCVTNTTPANAATGISTTSVNFTWAANVNANSYDLFFGTSVASATLIGNINGTSATYTPGSPLATSTTYFWYVVPRGCDGSSASGCSANATSFTTLSGPPANDECANATPLTINVNSCAVTTAGTITGSTASTGPSSTCGTFDDDVWFSFVAAGPTYNFTITAGTGISDYAHQIVSGTCGGSLTSLVCSDPNTSSYTGFVNGTTYYVRVASYTSTAGQVGNFTVCISTPPPPPANDECANAVAVTVNPALTCTSVSTGTVAGATASTGPSSSCGTYDDDVWFSFVATAPVHNFTLQNITGSTTDLTHQVLSGACGSQVALVCSDPNTSTATGLIIGQTYYIRVATWTATAGQTSAFEVCVTTPPNMSYVSSTTTQQTGSAAAGSVDQTIIRIEVTVINTNTPLSVTSLNLSTNGTSVPSDITNAKVYYTGTSTTFSTANLFGSFATPNGAFTVNGSQTLTGGTVNTVNYFWLTYDIACGATGPNLDGECTSFVIGGGSQTPTVTAPSGNKTVSVLASFNTVANGNWSNPATWACGVPPANTTVPININHNVTLDVNVNTNSNLTITAGAGRSLTVGANTLTIGPSGGGNRTLTVNGTLTISGGNLAVNGNVFIASGSTFNMSAGTLQIDPNDGTVGGSATASTTSLLISSGLGTVSGGTITFVDPNFNSGSGKALDYSVSTTPKTWVNTINMGDGISTQSSSNTGGFIIELYTSTGRLSLTDLNIKGGSTTNRWTSLGPWSVNVLGTTTVDGGSEFRLSSSSTPAVFAGNIVNNGTITSTQGIALASISGNSTVANTATQSISGNGVWRNLASSPTANLTSLTVNNTNAAAIVIPSNMISGVGTGSVSGTLTLTAGRLDVGSTPLILGTSASSNGTLTAPTSAGYVIGEFRRWITTTTGNRFFPIGTSTAPRFAQINFTSAQTTGGLISAIFNDAAPNTAGLPYTEGISIEQVSPTGSWTINRLSGAGGTYTAIVDATGFTRVGGGAITDLANVRLIKRTSGGNWGIGTDGTSASPIVLATATRTGCTAFSDFAIGGTAAALPIELTSFTGKTLTNSNMLSWETAAEVNVKSHIIERSADGIKWAAIGTVDANGIPATYELEDRAPIAKAYYRLRSVDFDGQEQTSNVIQLTRRDRGFGVTGVFPNPTSGDVAVQFAIPSEGEVVLRVSDMTGRVVLEQQFDAADGINQQTVAMSRLQTGTYLVTVIADNQVSEPVRVVKQ
jgi:hypothetical protein